MYEKKFTQLVIGAGELLWTTVSGFKLPVCIVLKKAALFYNMQGYTAAAVHNTAIVYLSLSILNDRAPP